jgi:hypothetical protein
MRRILVSLLGLALFANTLYAGGEAQDGKPVIPVAPVQGGIYWADTTERIQSMDNNGNLKVAESAPMFDQYGVAQDIIGPRTLNAAAADSSLPIDSHAWRVTGIYIKATPRTGVNTISRLAVQVRAHLNGASDSNSVYVWYPVPSAMSLGGNSVAGPDTTMTVGHATTGSASAPWSGEFTVVVNGNRSAPASGVAATAFAYPNGIYIPLTNYFGTAFWAPYVSVRVRNLVGANVDIRVSLIGTAL